MRKFLASLLIVTTLRAGTEVSVKCEKELPLSIDNYVGMSVDDMEGLLEYFKMCAALPQLTSEFDLYHATLPAREFILYSEEYQCKVEGRVEDFFLVEKEFYTNLLQFLSACSSKRDQTPI
jgi:hypothetical protein